MKANDLTQDALKAYLEYDPATGLFRRVSGRWRTGAEWYAGCPNNWGHLRIQVRGHLYQVHRLAWLYMTGAWPANGIDHINGDKRDNRFVNLRDADGFVNMQNRRAATTVKKSCRLLGAYKQGSKWMAKIQTNKTQTYLGLFDTPEEAHAAYVGAKRIMHPGCTI